MSSTLMILVSVCGIREELIRAERSSYSRIPVPVLPSEVYFKVSSSVVIVQRKGFLQGILWHINPCAHTG